MFEKLITDVLNKVLGDFIENIDPKQLGLSIGQGKVVLKDMQLKTTMFDNLPVPFQVAYGRIGLINIDIPIWNMFKKPLLIEIKDVMAIARPKAFAEWSEEVEIKAFVESVKNRLEQFELFQSNAENLKAKDPSSLQKLVTKIIDNI